MTRKESGWSDALRQADLLVDKIYVGGRRSNASDDPVPPLVGVSNQGGFRYLGSKSAPKLVVLTSNSRNLDWPNHLDKETGIFTYFGDNRQPGDKLHETPRVGNLLLRDMFDKRHGSQEARASVPPVLIFANRGAGYWRDVEFLGLAVPGAENLDSSSDLVAVWKLRDGSRFQNYQAKFTVLENQVVSRQWIEDIKRGEPFSINCPATWKLWAEHGVYRPLKAPRVIEHRKKLEQLPADDAGAATIATIHQYFANDPVRFEACAAKIAELMLPGIAGIDLTRPTRDGGRDAVGKYKIGNGPSAVLVDFALEAKCYGPENPVAVKELSRLISRLRHRQFGILVTTSYVAGQAYQEIKEDEHPIVVIAAADIVRLLQAAGIADNERLKAWLSAF